MKKPIVVLADLDANYLVPLEDKLTEELHDQIELEIITDKAYFDSYFSTPKKIDTLIISSSLFSQDLIRHNITDFFVLTEDIEETNSKENITYIFKYSSTKEILNQVIYKNKEILKVQFTHKETEVVIVTSAIGGAGKTTVALALSESLVKSHKRVLFISTDIMQGFAFYINNKATLPNDIIRIFNGSNENLFKSLTPYLRNEGFSYLPPFGRSLNSIGLDASVYNRIISAAKASKQFDFIVVDTDIQFDEAKAEMIHSADKVVVCVRQDSFSVFKTQFLVKNIDCRNSEKFIFVCNKFKRDIENDYVTSDIGKQFVIAEYIEDMPPFKLQTIENYCELKGIKNLAYMFF